MAIKFLISHKSDNKAYGRLTWLEKGLSSGVISGPYGRGELPEGLYHAYRYQLLDRPNNSSYCDSQKNCWFQVITPQFSTDRTDLGIHPDGNLMGTLGCIGILDHNTIDWYRAFYEIPRNDFIELEVIDQSGENVDIKKSIINFEFVSEKVLKDIIPENLTSDTILTEPIEYNRAPKTDLSLGKGFDPVDFQSIKRPGIVFSETRIDNGSPESNFEFLYVRDYESLERELQIDSKISASYLGNSIDSTRKLKYDRSFSSDSINVVIKAWSNYGRWSLNPTATLTNEAKALLNTNQKEFADTYGTRYVAVESRMNAIYIVITITATSALVKKRIESSMSINAGVGKLTAKARESVIDEIKFANKSDRVGINAYAVGGNGITGFKDLVFGGIKSEKDPLEFISKAISNTLSQMSAANAVPYSFLVGDMRNFGLTYTPQIEWSKQRSRALLKLNEIYESISYQLTVAKAVKAKTHPLFFLVDKITLEENLLQNIEVGERFLDDISDLHKNCRTNPSPDSYLIPDSIPQVFGDSVRDWLKTPTIRFKGGSWITFHPFPQKEEIQTQVLESIMNTSPDFRKDVVKSFFPDSKGLFIKFFAEGTGLSTMNFHDRIGASPVNHPEYRKVKEFEYSAFKPIISPNFLSFIDLNEKFEEGMAAGYRPREAEIIDGIVGMIRQSGNTFLNLHIDYDYELYCTIADKAGRVFTYKVMTINMRVRYVGNQVKKDNVQVNYFLMADID